MFRREQNHNYYTFPSIYELRGLPLAVFHLHSTQVYLPLDFNPLVALCNVFMYSGYQQFLPQNPPSN